jgi:hypothetical protein
MNTTSLPTQASVASWPSLNGAVSTQSSATSIVLAAAVQGESHSFLATARTWLRDLFTPPSTQDLEQRCLPSVAFTPGGPLVWSPVAGYAGGPDKAAFTETLVRTKETPLSVQIPDSAGL